MTTITKRFDLRNIEKLKDFDSHEGSRRTEIKVYGRVIEYRGFEIVRNNYIPVGAEGYWEVPNLYFLTIGGVKRGFLTVSIIQSKEAIDRYFELNQQLKELETV